ncbi:MAG: lyase family protein [Bacteroidales bacterium]|nr:lyase family protein [Bacteroidales bacterium]
MRKEKDVIGEVELPSEALYGIHAWRSTQNFPDRTSFHREWYEAVGLVKLAAYKTVLAFMNAAGTSLPGKPLPSGLEDAGVFEKLSEAAGEVAAGKHFEHFIVPAVQGGAGTSINMNVNEIITNLALKKMNRPPGSYSLIDPLRHANLFQSTNDVVPTALKLAVMKLLVGLEERINELRSLMEHLETKHRNDLRLAYTQMQEAVPSSWGMLLGAYNEALSRDWWRVSKCFERIKVVNLGGGATGSGLAIPRYYIMEVVSSLQKISGFPLTRSENLSDATQNLDAFVEVHAILKAHAVNLEKIASDIRLLASDVAGRPPLRIPQKQLGSSIMPGKVNPVISEFVVGVSHKVYSNDMLIGSLCGQACLDLNAYLPVIGHAMLESLKLLKASCKTIKENMLDQISIDTSLSLEKLLHSPAITTALVPYTGYDHASKMAYYMKEHQCDIYEANRVLKLLPDAVLERLMKPEHLLRLGYSIKDL